MPSFTTILSYAALGLAAFASVHAAPSPSPLSLGAGLSLSLGLGAGSKSSDCSKSLPSVMGSLAVDLNTCLLPLKYGTSANITVEVVTPIFQKACGLVSTALVDVKALTGKKSSSILLSVKGVLSITEIASLLCTLITVIFSTVHICLSVCVAANKAAISVIICEFLGLVAQLLQCTLGLVPGCLSILLPQIFKVSARVICELDLWDVFACLAIAI